MTLTWPFVSALAAFLLAWRFTGWFRGYAVARRLLDIPNERSSHRVPTPRGAGLALAFATIAVFVTIGALQLVQWSRLSGLIAASALMTVVGFADDRRGIRRRWRIAAQSGAALLILGAANDVGTILLGGFIVDHSWVPSILLLLYVVWLLNLTNFMDGIDGIAAVESVSVAIAAVMLYLVVDAQPAEWATPLIVAAASSGFLVWNWPPAKVFLGDAGSSFLGVMFAALPLQAVDITPRLFWAWMILLGVFIVDSTVTLLRRIARGDRFYDAHRTHAYQHAAHRFGSHKLVTILVAVINCVWLLPLAVLVTGGMLPATTGVLVAYTPLVFGALLLGAGRPQRAPAERPVQPI